MNATELIERARAMAPALRGRAAEGDSLRRLPDATIQDMKDAGFFRMLQPSRWGGHEVDPRTFFEVQWTLAAACPSTAWVLGVVGVHAWQLALFPLEAQQEVWGDDSSTLISSSYAPTGKVEIVEGGYRVSGRWSFSSGSDHCKWAFLGGFVPTAPGERPDMRTFLLPRRDYRIEDNWHTMGLKATGSNDVVVEGAFVPEHRTHRLIDGFKRNSPGNAVNPSPLFRLPFGQVFVRSVSTTAIGVAQGALDAYCEAAAKRVAAGDGAKVAEDPTAQVAAAQAEAAIDESKSVLLRDFDEMMAAVRGGGDLPVERRIKFRYNSARVAQRCMEAVDGLMTASGGRAIFTGAQIQRYFLDAHTARAHYANNPDKPGRNFGGVQLKLKNSDFFL
jgi:3-hydroxy-9,10-secoandrosta-1,3,5(10)-triene-9,17-dione monooxygenase